LVSSGRGGTNRALQTDRKPMFMIIKAGKHARPGNRVQVHQTRSTPCLQPPHSIDSTLYCFNYHNRNELNQGDVYDVASMAISCVRMDLRRSFVRWHTATRKNSKNYYKNPPQFPVSDRWFRTKKKFFRFFTACLDWHISIIQKKSIMSNY
jgi:hypothetical protein